MLRMLAVAAAISLFPAAVPAADNPAPGDAAGRTSAGARAQGKSLSAAALKSWIEEKKDFLLLDVREPDEVEAARIVAENHAEIPRGVMEFVFPLRGEKPGSTVVVYCLLGVRSAAVAEVLTGYGFTKVYNLDGGIMGWIREGYPVSNFIGSFTMKDLDSAWLDPSQKTVPAGGK